MLKNPSSILIVDDNPDDILIVRRAILKSRPDSVVEVAGNGHEAIERLRNEQPPALILLDIKMPGIDGFEVLKFIRSHKPTEYVPVIMLTSSVLEDDIKASYDAGANGFLHKALGPVLFTAAIKATLHFWLDFNVSPSFA